MSRRTVKREVYDEQALPAIRNYPNRGVYAMPGVMLALRTENEKHVSVLTSTSGNIHLKKGAQLVLEATS